VDIYCTATDLPLSKVSRGQDGGADHGVMESISSCRSLLESQKCESSEESWKEQTKGRGGGKGDSLALAGASLCGNDALLDLAILPEDGSQLLHSGAVIQATEK
jgi:hypothetical protein